MPNSIVGKRLSGWQGSTFHQEVEKPRAELVEAIRHLRPPSMEEEEFEEELNRPSEPSPLNQKWCKEYPEDMWQEMLRITEESADRYVEMGASIRETGDPGDISKWKLAAIHSGNAYSVTIPRLRDSTGVFHTHPFGVHYPTGSDIIEMIANEDKVICIGRGGYSDVEVNCYGKPIFQSMENRTFELLNRVEKFNSYIKEHYSGITGQNLRLWLAENDEPSLVIMRNLEQEKNQLQREASSWSQQLFEHKQDCRWSRLAEKFIRGGVPSARPPKTSIVERGPLKGREILKTLEEKVAEDVRRARGELK